MDDQLLHDNRVQKAQGPVYNEDEGFLLVQLDRKAYGLPDIDVEFQGKRFSPKDELHITILSREQAEIVRSELAQQPEKRDRFRRLIEEADWNYRKLERFYHVAEEPDKETIIQMVDIQALDTFFQELSGLLHRKLDPPPTHVTLYTRNTSKGIGLPSQEVFERLVQGEVSLSSLNLSSSRASGGVPGEKSFKDGGEQGS